MVSFQNFSKHVTIQTYRRVSSNTTQTIPFGSVHTDRFANVNRRCDFSTVCRKKRTSGAPLQKNAAIRFPWLLFSGNKLDIVCCKTYK